MDSRFHGLPRRRSPAASRPPSVLERLTAEDARILKLERGAIRGHTCKVLVLERAPERPLPTVDQLRDHIASRLDAAPRLRQRVVKTPLRIANPVWLDDPGFDIARHVTEVPADGSTTQAQLERIVAELMAGHLDREHPLWRLDVVSQLEGGAMALVWRVHHSLADGTTCVRIGSQILWDEVPDPQPAARRSWTPATAPSGIALFAMGLGARAQRKSSAVEAPRPRSASWASLRTVLTRELRPSAAPTPLAHHVGRARSVAFASAPLADCKRAAKAIADHATVNDIALAILAGGVREWLERGPGVLDRIRVKVPVSLHQLGEDDAIANRDSYFFVDLPVAETDPAKRVLAISRETRQRKLDHDAEMLYQLGMHPLVSRWAMSPRVFTFNVSNVRGPASDVYVLGARVKELYSLAEVAHQHALRVAVISAAGSLFFGLCADHDAVGDLQVLAAGLRTATDELLTVAR